MNGNPDERGPHVPKGETGSPFVPRTGLTAAGSMKGDPHPVVHLTLVVTQTPGFRRAGAVARGVRQQARCIPTKGLYQPSLWPQGRGPSTTYTEYTMPLNITILTERTETTLYAQSRARNRHAPPDRRCGRRPAACTRPPDRRRRARRRPAPPAAPTAAAPIDECAVDVQLQRHEHEDERK